MTIMSRAALLSIFAAAVVTAAPSQQNPQTFRSGTTDVLVDVSVERKNAPVTGLTAEDFQVIDDGTPQAIALADSTSMPVDVSLLFDRGYFASQRIGHQFGKDIASMAGMLHQDDRVQVVTFATAVSQIVPMMSARDLPPLPDETLWKTGRTYWDGLHDPMLKASLSDALLFAAARPVDVSRRHMVVAFSGSLDGGSVLKFDQGLGTALLRSGALVVLAMWDGWGASVALPDGLSPLSQVTFLHQVLTDAAEATGGEVRSASDGVKAFKEILSSFRQRYLLHFTPKDMDKKGWHELSVRVPKRRDVQVRARRGYFVN